MAALSQFSNSEGGIPGRKRKWPASPTSALQKVPLPKQFSAELLCMTNDCFSLFFLINLFIYLFLAVLGLCCCSWAFSSCGERGLLFVAVRGLLIVMASLVAELGL